MNKNDFEIFSPTSKQKTEMKERLMLEAECLSTVQNGTGRVISVDANELIEAKPRTKKPDFVMKFATIAAAVAFVAVVSGFFIMNNNGVQTLAGQESTSEALQSEVSSDEPSDTTESSLQEENTENNTVNADNILSSVLIQNVTKINDNTLLAIAEKNFILIDTDSHRITKEIPRDGGKLIQKIDNGFAIISRDYDDCYFEIYDVNGNVKKHVAIPTRPVNEQEIADGVTYTQVPLISIFYIHISADGEKVIYQGENGFCVNTTDLDNEIVIQPVEEFNGGFEEFYVMCDYILYRDDVVYGQAYKYNPEKDENEFYFAGYNLETKGWTVYYEMQDKQQIFNQDSFVDNSFLIVDAGADSRYTDGKLPYYVIGDTEMKEFVCEEGRESVRAFISGNAKYIVTHSEYWTEAGEPLPSALKLYDIETGEILLTKEYAHNLQTAYIDEATRTLYAICGTQFFTMNF